MLLTPPFPSPLRVGGDSCDSLHGEGEEGSSSGQLVVMLTTRQAVTIGTTGVLGLERSSQIPLLNPYQIRR